MDKSADLERIEKIHHVLKELWTLPKTSHKIGLVTLFLVFPGGSTVSFFVKLQYIIVAYRHEFSQEDKRFIIKLLIIDWLLGIPPILGIIFTHMFKADRKIISVMERNLQYTAIEDGNEDEQV